MVVSMVFVAEMNVFKTISCCDRMHTDRTHCLSQMAIADLHQYLTSFGQSVFRVQRFGACR
jgi:hypothetical protein